MSAPKPTSAFAAVLDDSNPAKLALHRYMDQYELSDEDKDANVNFISMAPQYRKRFFVPTEAVPQMMSLLNECYRLGIDNHFLELQDVTDTNSSGLVFEFKFESEYNKIDFDGIVGKFIRILFRDILTQWIEFSEDCEEHYCFYLGTKVPEYDGKTLKFKSTFRIVIPSVILTSDVRYFIYHRVWQSKDIKDVFMKGIHYHIRHCFKRHMRTVPVSLLGSGDIDQSSPLELRAVRTIEVDNGTTDGDSNSIDSFGTRFPNLVNEASINYPFNEGIIVKSHYLPRDCCLERMELENDDYHNFQRAYDLAKATFIKQLVTDIEVKNMYDMTLMLDKSRFTDIDTWTEIMKSLASAGNRYHCVAVMATKDNCKKLISWTEFEECWTNAINTADKTRYSAKALRYWAACDSPSRMHRYVEESIRNMVIADIRDSVIQGRLGHSHLAEYLHFMFQNTYITFNVTKTVVYWYEFVTPLTRDAEPGQLYKWRCIGIQPDRLSSFISSDFKRIAGTVHNDLKSLMMELSKESDSKDESKIKNVKQLYCAFNKAIIQIVNNGFKRSVIDESTGLFKRNYFIKQMDKSPLVLGVGNGVLEFGPTENKLLDYFHTYPISLYTDTNYIPYNANSKYVKTIYKMLNSLVPDDEQDALEFLLYYFSTSLDWLQKESLFFIIHGGGCHAIDTPIRMFDGSIKMVQDVIVGDELMGDDNTSRKVQELFRGTDEMVRILPTKGESFEVNKDHVLSLKNAKGDITDIKVKDFMKWTASAQETMRIYKPDGTTSAFAIKEIGQGDYYGFELDGNHRYLTGDFYVHHNSNGKSMILELFRRTLGELYVRKMPLSFITDQNRTRSSSADPAIMDLKDARLVYYSESDRNEKVNVAKVKEITGGEALSGRQLYKEQENFRANCNHIVTTNHRFVIETTEHAVWRRFISYKFKICFKHECNPDEKNERPRDDALIQMIMNDKRYQEAFLSILIHYRTMLYAKYDGQILKVPRPTIIRETEEYRQSEDIFQKYIMQKVYYCRDFPPMPLEDLCNNFRDYYQVENNGERYKGKTPDMIATFMNTAIGKYIIDVDGVPVLKHLYSIKTEGNKSPGSILFSKWQEDGAKVE